MAAACFRARLAGEPSPAGERTARVLAGYRRTGGDRGRGQTRSFGAADLAAVLATCHRPRRRGRGVESDPVARERGRARGVPLLHWPGCVPGGLSARRGARGRLRLSTSGRGRKRPTGPSVRPAHAVMLKDIASWLLRTLDAPSAWLFMAVFAAGTLCRFPEIESGVAAQKPGWWLELVEPFAWATIAVALRVLGVPIAVRLWVALSPTYRFRQLARRADELAAELSDGGNYYPVFVVGEVIGGGGTPQLEVVIAAFKADLSALGVRRTPPINDVDGWKRAVPRLRALMSLGALSDARNDDWTS